MRLLSIIIVLFNILPAQIALPTFQAVHSKSNASIISLPSDTLTFTNCGVTGRNGPTQSQINSTYTLGNSLYNSVTINTQGIQEWTVPQTGSYTIEVWGAEGGSTSRGYDGGKGARMKGTFTLSQGTVLKILVGQQGPDVSCTPGGGGGSFVTLSDNSPLIIAGGGGGASTDYDGIDAVVSGSGTSNTAETASGGTNGSGGGSCTTGTYSGGGGGGLLTDGEDGARNSGRGYAFVNGGQGGDRVLSGGGYGGFGGGGGTANCTVGGGGGGGYSGGAGGEHYNECGPTDYKRSAGGGGGSYNGGSSADNSAGVREGHGQVVIMY